MTPPARGRLLPSNLSRSQPFGALSIHSKALYPLLVVNADDQGRLPGAPESIKWAVCPNANEITIDMLPDLLREMADVGLVILYTDGSHPVIQLTQWWADQSSMEWAYPSEFTPPEGWKDRLRIRGARHVLTINWPGAADSDPATLPAELPRQLRQASSLAVALARPPAVATSPGGVPDTHPTPIRHPSDTRLSHRQHEHEHEHEHEEGGTRSPRAPETARRKTPTRETPRTETPSATTTSPPAPTGRHRRGAPGGIQLKLFQVEAGVFLDEVEQQEGVRLPRETLMPKVRQAIGMLGGDDRAAALDLAREWYRWARRHDSWGRRVEPATLLRRMADKLPYWAKQRGQGQSGGGFEEDARKLTRWRKDTDGGDSPAD